MLKNTTEKLDMVKMAKPILTIMNGTIDNPYETIEINDNTRKYIHVKVNNVVKQYSVSNDLSETNNRFHLGRCTSDFLSQTTFEKNFFENSGSINHCMENNWVHLQGTRDSATNLEDHAYVVYEVSICTEEGRDEDDPECADEDEINEWLS